MEHAAKRPLPPLGPFFRRAREVLAKSMAFGDHPPGDLSLAGGTANRSMDARATLNARIASRMLHWRQESEITLLRHLRAKNFPAAANASKDSLVVACLATEFELGDVQAYLQQCQDAEVHK